MSKHTPEPWKLDFRTNTIIRDEDPTGEWRTFPRSICDIHNDDDRQGDGTAKANATLIAAAPELLDALQQIHDTFEKDGRFPNVLPELAALIKKAKGE